MSRAGTIDGPRFAAERGVVTGTLALCDLARLAELGCEAATVRYEVRGSQDTQSRATLGIVATGDLELVCQRCLGPVDFPLAVTSELELAGSQAEIDTANDEQDRVLASRAMDVASLVEDEVILALPMSPVHERCESAAGRAANGGASPFAALTGLRGSGAAPDGGRRKRNT